MEQTKVNNAGFSLVELIVVVSILAIAAIPLMKSMSMATRVNVKAQSLQNATSLGEKIMEEMKSLSINEIKAKYGPVTEGGTGELTISSDAYVITMPNRLATQGEKFTVIVTMDKSKYSNKEKLGTNDKENVQSANTVKLPRIEDIDTLSQAVLTSDKEFNRYDKSALSFFNERIKDGDPPTTIIKKTINIEKGKVDGISSGTTVTANVVYVDSGGNEYVRDLYTGTFIQQEGSPGLDSNIYIFYKRGNVSEIPSTVTEEINITDKLAYSNPTKPKDSHRIYFIRQDSGNDGPIVNIYRKSVSVGEDDNEIETVLTSHVFKYSDGADSLEDWYTASSTDIEFLTNVINNTAGKVYKEEARTRVYDITVELYDKDGNKITTLNSSDSVNDKP